MTDPAPTPTPPAAPTPAPAPAPEPPAQDPTDWKAEARKWESRAKENSGARKELDELKAAQMTEAEKQAAALAEAQAKVAAYEVEKQVAAWKDAVSQEAGVPAAALAGSTLEEIQAHADVLKSLITPAQPPTPLAPTVPSEGTPPVGGVGSQLSHADIKSMTPEQINEARRAGLLNQLMGIS